MIRGVLIFGLLHGDLHIGKYMIVPGFVESCSDDWSMNIAGFMGILWPKNGGGERC